MIIDQVERLLAERAPRIVALGEPMHGVAAFPELRDAILRRMPGCRAVAIESECLAGLRVDEYVRTGVGDPVQVVAEGLSPPFNAIPQNAALVAHLRATGGIRFAPFDVPMGFRGGQSPRVALRLLHGIVGEPGTWDRIDALLGADERWHDPAVLHAPETGLGASAEAAELRVITEELTSRLAGLDPDGLRVAELAARTAAGLLDHHAVLARTHLTDTERLLGGLDVRDRLMADNLLALERTDGPVLAFAHNEHVRRGRADIVQEGVALRWTTAGERLGRALGPDYLALTTVIGTAPDLGLGEPPPGTIEAVLAADPTPRLVLTSEIDARGLVPRPRDAPNYHPLDPAELADVDAVVFLPRV